MTVIDSLEMEEQIVIDRLARIRDEILDAIAPDGRPYGQAKMSRREQVRDYVKNLKDNEEAWHQWVVDRVMEINQALAGMPPEAIAQVSPWSIAIQWMLMYSASMEQMLGKEEERVGT